MIVGSTQPCAEFNASPETARPPLSSGELLAPLGTFPLAPLNLIVHWHLQGSTPVRLPYAGPVSKSSTTCLGTHPAMHILSFFYNLSAHSVSAGALNLLVKRCVDIVQLSLLAIAARSQLVPAAEGVHLPLAKCIGHIFFTHS